MSDEKRARPAEGGSYARKGGKLELVERTQPQGSKPAGKAASSSPANPAPAPIVKEK